ncbi:unnamed protein product [Urochloa humidicola]
MSTCTSLDHIVGLHCTMLPIKDLSRLSICFARKELIMSRDKSHINVVRAMEAQISLLSGWMRENYAAFLDGRSRQGRCNI